MHVITQQIIEVFQEERDLDRALQMKNYLRGKFEYFGLSAPLRRDLSKIHLAEISKEGRQIVYQIIRELWQQQFRELHYFGQEFFLNKAIGWLLREYSKNHPQLI